MAAGLVILIVVILLAFAVKGCESSDTTNSLKDYNNAVSDLIDSSDSTGANLFTELKSGGGASNASTVQEEITGLSNSASSQLTRAKDLSVPTAMASAQDSLLQTMQLRADGLQSVAKEVEQALNSSSAAASSAIGAIAIAMSQFYASDVVYKTQVVPAIAAALHSDGIPVGGTSGVAINPGQFLHDLGWLQSTFVATEIGAKVSGGSTNGSTTNGPGAGPHGHELNSVSLDGTTLSPNGTNDASASAAPSFIISFANSGQTNEYNVHCKVTIAGANESGTATVQETTPGQSTTCQVNMKSAVTAGTYQVTATVEPVPGESDTANNSATYAVDFQ